uniref:3',5'-cyclic-GMP phosphodiesterase n=1 Tax=Knipowitschia caucasica TaxID=637954 RepID=A0AAV2LLX8_KNICA
MFGRSGEYKRRRSGLQSFIRPTSAATDVTGTMADVAAPADKKAPPKFKQRAMRTFKSKAPKPGQKGFGDDIPGMEGLGTDITVVCPWEAFGDMELSDLAKYGIV